MALLGDLQRVFENTYGRATGVDVERCLVGPRRCAQLARRSGGPHVEMSRWARFFFYVEDGTLRLAIFFSDELVAELEARDPRRMIDEANVVPFLVLAEECSHAVHTPLAFLDGGSDRIHGPDFLAELEVLARVDAYLVLRHFVDAHVDTFTARDRAWVRHQAVDRWNETYDDPVLDARYRVAAGVAGAFVDRLEGLDPSRRLAELRRFRRGSMETKRRLAGRAPA